MNNTNSLPPPEGPTLILVEKVLKLNSILESLDLIRSLSFSGIFCKKEKDSDVMRIELVKDNDCPNNEELDEDNDVLGEEKIGEDHFDKIPTRSEIAYHKNLMYAPVPSMILSDPIILGGNSLNLKIPCNIWHVHVGRAYIDLNSPLNIMTRTLYNWIMASPLEPRIDSKSPSGISNFTGRVKGMPIFVRNFIYAFDFMIVEDIRVVKFKNGIEEITYKMPHKIEQYDSLSDMENENMKSVYFRNEEDKRKGVEYVMSKILGFYKECLELGPEYRTGLEESSSEVK
ncbi:hypothetical protein Tco_1016135 [Tanacetum coccineum]|uniref:Uncharacterized protein n=1 Tax=Tanacetum coccineum TaxID=301880 RepID=A0ABQ5FMS5_9ASTR